MDTREIRNKLFEIYVENLKACKDDTRAYYMYAAVTSDLMSKINQHFSYDIDEDNILMLVSTSALSDGKSGAVITTEGVYYLPWTVFGTGTVMFWSHDEIYREFAKNATNFNTMGMSNVSGVLDENILPYLMINIAIMKTAIVRVSNTTGEIGFPDAVAATARLGKTLLEYDSEKERMLFFERVHNVFAESLFTMGRPVEPLSLDGLDKIYEDVGVWQEGLVDVSEEGAFNAQDELYKKIISCGVLFSCLIVSACRQNINFEEAEIEGFQLEDLGIDDISFPASLINLVKPIYIEDEYRKYTASITKMLVVATTLARGWTVLGEIEINSGCYLIASCIQIVINCIKMECKKALKVADDQFLVQETVMDWLKNYPNHEAVIPDKRVGRLIKEISKAGVRLKSKHFPDFVYSINGTDDQGYNFFVNTAGLNKAEFSLENELPFLAIALNRFFCVGISFGVSNIVWNYPDGSPEAKIMELLEMNTTQGSIDISGRGFGIFYVGGLPFTLLEIIVPDEEFVFLPITPLKIAYAKELCVILSKIYKVSGYIIVTKQAKVDKETLDDIQKIYDCYYPQNCEILEGMEHKDILQRQDKHSDSKKITANGNKKNNLKTNKPNLLTVIVMSLLMIVYLAGGIFFMLGGVLAGGIVLILGGVIFCPKIHLKTGYKVILGILSLVVSFGLLMKTPI